MLLGMLLIVVIVQITDGCPMLLILPEMLGKTAALVWDESGEEVASYGEEEEPLTELSDEEYDEYFDEADECGFDPYEGCYTFDC